MTKQLCVRGAVRYGDVTFWGIWGSSGKNVGSACRAAAPACRVPAGGSSGGNAPKPGMSRLSYPENWGVRQQ